MPTPIGNLGDLSLRQYEALTQCDIIACEDTRKTGKMLELIKQKRLKDKFKKEFGANIEDFFEEEVNKEEATKKPRQEDFSDKDEQYRLSDVEEEGDEQFLKKLLEAN